MKTLYIMRHGQTDWNLEGKLQGCADIELNEQGISDANALVEKLKSLNIDKIYTSPLKRALQTAIIASDYNIDVVIENDLKERDFGVLEGQTQQSIRLDYRIPDELDFYKQGMDLYLNDVDGIESVGL